MSEYAELVANLRMWASVRTDPDVEVWLDAAADAIGALEAKVERMAAALRHAADTLNGCECEEAYDTLRELGIPLEEGDE